MRAEPDRDFFLLTGIEWATVGATSPDGALRATSAVLARESAYCHLLFRAGKWCLAFNPGPLSHRKLVHR